MTTRGFRPLIVISFTFALISFGFGTAFANSLVESEFELKLPRGFQQTIIDKTWRSLQEEKFQTTLPLPDQTFRAVETDVLLSGISLDFETQLQKPNVPEPGPSIVLESRNMSAQLRVDAITVDQWIVREIGGVIGRFHLQARCENLLLQMKPGEGSFRMRLSPVIEGSRIQARLDEMDLAWSAQAWSVGPMNCTGAKGFEDVIAEHILNLTKDSAVLTERKAELMTYVQNFLDTKSVDLSKPRVLTSGRPDIQYSMRVKEFISNGDVLSAHGTVSVIFKNVKSEKSRYLRLAKRGSSSSSGSGAQLRVPRDLLTVMIERAFLPNTWKARVMSDEVPGFESLMANTWLKCLLWPELEHFNKDDKFAFVLDTRTPVNVIPGRGFNYLVSTVMDVDMLAPKVVSGKQRLVPFMKFQIPLKSEIEVSLNRGQLLAAFKNVQVSLQHEWEPSYIAAYRPNQNFYPEELRRKFLKEAEGAKISFRLPVIQIFDELSLRVQSVSSRSDSNDLVLTLN